MTINSIDKFVGIRMPKEEFFRWLLNNKDHKWYEVVKKTSEEEKFDFEEYTEKLENDEEDKDYHHIMIFGNLRRYGDKCNNYIRVDVLRHDRDSQDAIIGVIVATYDTCSIIDLIEKPEQDLRKVRKECGNKLKKLGLIQDHNELGNHAVQDDCRCCT